MSKEKHNKKHLEDMEHLFMLAVTDQFSCQNCGSGLEPDAEHCGMCGWNNPLRAGGFI